MYDREDTIIDDIDDIDVEEIIGGADAADAWEWATDDDESIGFA